MSKKSFLGGLFRKSSQTEKTNMIAPFVGSELRSHEKEAMAYVLFQTIRRNERNLGDIISCSEVYETIRQLEKEKRLPTVYQRSPQACWNAFREMGDQGQMTIAPKDGPNEAWIIIMPDSILAEMIWEV